MERNENVEEVGKKVEIDERKIKEKKNTKKAVEE